MGWITEILAILLSYLLGSVPTAYLTSRFIGKIDIRTVGSGNVGATNVLRTLGKGPGAAVLLLDALKGVLAVSLVASCMFDSRGPFTMSLLKVLCFLAAVSGHIWPVFLRFRGGKGVAASAGGFLALYPPAFLVSAAVFLAVTYSTRYVSLGSLLAAVALPASLVLMHAPKEIAFIGVAAAALVVFQHRSNIGRLLRGVEKKLGEKAQIHE